MNGPSRRTRLSAAAAASPERSCSNAKPSARFARSLSERCSSDDRGRVADRLEQHAALRRVAGAHERNAEVETCESGPRRIVVPDPKRGRRVGVTAERHEDVRLEQATLGLELARQRALNPREIARGLLVVTALIADPRKIEERAIRDGRVEAAGQQAVENAVGFRVQAERQVHSAGEHLGFRGMIRQPAEVPCSLEAHDGIEIVVLEELEQHVAVVQVANLAPRRFLCDCGRSGPEQRGARTWSAPLPLWLPVACDCVRSVDPRRWPGSRRYSQTFTTNSGCSDATRSLILSSI